MIIEVETAKFSKKNAHISSLIISLNKYGPCNTLLQKQQQNNRLNNKEKTKRKKFA